ncbi:MAG: hypothetical protein GY806_05445, partial [Gammaproteobacteria bacterium]|nr:hypothetical protein [Gammaproteobacteria bacterium]
MKLKFSSIRVRLLLCFMLISGFAVVGALTANYSFQQVSEALQSITRHQLPAALSAGDLARSAERIVAIAPRLLNARNEAEQASVHQQLEIETTRLNSLLASLRDTLNRHDFETLSPAVTTLRENLNKLDSIVGTILQLASNKNELIRQFDEDYISFERILAPRLLAAQARLQQLQNAAEKKQAINIAELVEATRSVQPLQQLQLEVRALRDSLLEVASEIQLNNLALLSFPVERSKSRINALLEELPGDLQSALSPQIILIFRYLTEPLSIIAGRTRELSAIKKGHHLSEENKVLSQRLTQAVDELSASTFAAINAANQEVAKVQREGQIIVLVVVFLALLSSVLIIWLYVDRRIVSRLKSLSDNMEAIAGGNLQKQIS